MTSKIKSAAGYLLVFLLPIFIFYQSEGADLGFILDYGRYIVENRTFPHESIHSIVKGMPYVMQQPLFNVLTYLLYSVGGASLLFIVNKALIGITNVIFLKIQKEVCNNTYAIIIGETVWIILSSSFFQKVRPWTTSNINLMILLYLLIRYSKTDDKKYLYPLPVISLLEINMHAACFPVLFCFILPFLIPNSIYSKGPFYKEEEMNFKRKSLYIVTITMLLTGLLNPYGIDNLTFFKYFEKESLAVCQEAAGIFSDKSNIWLSISILIIPLITLIYLAVSRRKNNVNPIYFCLLMGTTIMAVRMLRSTAYQCIGATIFILSLLPKEKDPAKAITKKDTFLLIITLLAITVGIRFRSYSSESEAYTNDNLLQYIIENYNPQNTRVYALNPGATLRFYGYDTIASPNIEENGYKMNKTENFYLEAYKFENGLIDYKEYVDKYDFDILCVPEDSLVYESLVCDDNYILKSEGYIWDSYSYLKSDVALFETK